MCQQNTAKEVCLPLMYIDQKKHPVWTVLSLCLSPALSSSLIHSYICLFILKDSFRLFPLIKGQQKHSTGELDVCVYVFWQISNMGSVGNSNFSSFLFWLVLKQKDLVGFPQSVKHGVWERVSGCWHRLSEALVYVSQAFSWCCWGKRPTAEMSLFHLL